MENSFSSQELRIVDANLNRLKEGIRVVEDIFRYAFDHKEIASSLKVLRHEVRLPLLYKALLDSRNSEHDVLRPSTHSEMSRSSLETIIIANLKRAQEASRVLEELFKTIDTQQAQSFKNVRYALYTLEKRAFEYLATL